MLISLSCQLWLAFNSRQKKPVSQLNCSFLNRQCSYLSQYDLGLFKNKLPPKKTNSAALPPMIPQRSISFQTNKQGFETNILKTACTARDPLLHSSPSPWCMLQCHPSRMTREPQPSSLTWTWIRSGKHSSTVLLICDSSMQLWGTSPSPLQRQPREKDRDKVWQRAVQVF